MVVTARRGEDDDDTDDVLDVASGTGEAQRLVPVAVARAEAAWLAGRPADIVAEIDHAWPAAVAEAQPVVPRGAVVVADGRRRATRESSTPLAHPFALLCAGEWDAAARVWDELGCPFWTATALARMPDLAPARRALSLVRPSRARAFEHALIRDRAAAGLPIPRGPRRAHRNLPHHLTTRELEVLRLVADGMSNAEVGATLFLSEKTVGHHVSAVLRKLGEPTRSPRSGDRIARGHRRSKIGNLPDVTRRRRRFT